MTSQLDDKTINRNSTIESLESPRFRFYLSTSYNEFKKIHYQGIEIRYCKYGTEGAFYWAKINKATTLGCITADFKPEEYMIESNLDDETKQSCICCLGTEINNFDNPKRLNRVNIDWQIDNSVDKLSDLKTFLENTEHHMIESVLSDAEQEFRRLYNIQLKNFVQDNEEPFDSEVYEKYVNRFVIGYDIYAIDKKSGSLNLFIVEWNDKPSIQYIEDNFDKLFIKTASFIIRK